MSGDIAMKQDALRNGHVPNAVIEENLHLLRGEDVRYFLSFVRTVTACGVCEAETLFAPWVTVHGRPSGKRDPFLEAK